MSGISFRLSALVLFFGAIPVGCGTPIVHQVSGQGATQMTVDVALKDFLVTKPRVEEVTSYDREGLQMIQAVIRNPGLFDLNVGIEFRWRGPDGVVQGNLSQEPRDYTLLAKDSVVVTCPSPFPVNFHAQSVTIIIRNQE